MQINSLRSIDSKNNSQNKKKSNHGKSSSQLEVNNQSSNSEEDNQSENSENNNDNNYTYQELKIEDLLMKKNNKINNSKIKNKQNFSSSLKKVK